MTLKIYLKIDLTYYYFFFGGWEQNMPCDAKFDEKCPCSFYNKTASIKQISLFDTALVIQIPKF